jgi:hypothetical protein
MKYKCSGVKSGRQLDIQGFHRSGWIAKSSQYMLFKARDLTIPREQ